MYRPVHLRGQSRRRNRGRPIHRRLAQANISDLTLPHNRLMEGVSSTEFALTGSGRGEILRKPEHPCLRRNLGIGTHPQESWKTRSTVVCRILFVNTRRTVSFLAWSQRVRLRSSIDDRACRVPGSHAADQRQPLACGRDLFRTARPTINRQRPADPLYRYAHTVCRNSDEPTEARLEATTLGTPTGPTDRVSRRRFGR
jgi:hypothetical protein